MAASWYRFVLSGEFYNDMNDLGLINDDSEIMPKIIKIANKFWISKNKMYTIGKDCYSNPILHNVVVV